MPPSTRASRATSITSRSWPGEARLSAEQLAAAAGISRVTLARLVRLAALEPATPDGDEFPAATASRLRRMLRLHADLGVGFFASAIILDLLDRIERLESERVQGRSRR